MSLKGEEALILSESYTDEALEGAGALKGEDGKSAYQIWLDLGNTGTEQDFIDSLKGYGADGFSPVITENSNNTDEDYRLDIETKESKFTTPNLKADIRKNIAEHNTSPDSHNDIRIFLNELNNRLNALANSDDETLDEMKEVVAYIKDNRSLIESITTTKVNVADIIDNLITNVSNKPLSASQGVVIKNLIDTLQSELTAHTNNADIHVTAIEKESWNNKADNNHVHEYIQVNTIADGTDLNGIQTAGFYRCQFDNVAQSLVNCPTTYSFFMIVGRHNGVYQEIIEYGKNPKRYMRNYRAGEWVGWYRIYSTANPPTLEEMNVEVGGTNLLTGEYFAPENVIITDDKKVKFDYSDTIDKDCYFFVNMHKNFILGKEYTISFDVENSEGEMSVYIGAPSNEVKLKNGRVSKTFIASAGIVNRHANKLLIDDVKNSITLTSNNVLLSNFKLERGNVATDWSPAPEDKANKVHTHEITDVNGLQTSLDSKLDKTATELGVMRDKTIEDLRIGLDDWIEVNRKYPNSRLIFYGEMSNIVSMWNSNNLTGKLYGGVAITVEIDAYYVASDYTLLKFTTYNSKEVYYVARVNFEWKPIHKVAFTDDILNAKALVDSSGTPLQIGESTKPVYFVDGKPVVCDLTIDAIQGLRAELDELRSLITNS